MPSLRLGAFHANREILLGPSCATKTMRIQIQYLLEAIDSPLVPMSLTTFAPDGDVNNLDPLHLKPEG